MFWNFFFCTFLLTKQPRKMMKSSKIRLNTLEKYKKLCEEVVSGLRVKIMVMF